MQQEPDHLADETKLHETGTPSEKHGTAYQDGDDDILERGDGTTSAYGPYANQLGYVYRPLNNAFLLSQAQLRKLDRSAADVIQNIEKSILLSGNILASSVTYTPTAPIVGNNVQDALDSVASQLGTTSTTGFIKFTYTV